MYIAERKQLRNHNSEYLFKLLQCVYFKLFLKDAPIWCHAKKIYYFPRFITAVPIMGPGFLQPIFFKVSLHRVLGIGPRIQLGYQKAQIDKCKWMFLFFKQYWLTKVNRNFKMFEIVLTKLKDRTTKNYFYDPF